MGFDAGKKVKGKKRFLVVDALGLLLAVFVCSAGAQEVPGGRVVLQRVRGGGPMPRFARLRLIWADRGYLNANFLAWVKGWLGYVVEITKRPPGATGFTVLPRRWVVERTFAWLGRYRRLSKDYEQWPWSSEAFCYLAMTHLMVRRLAP